MELIPAIDLLDGRVVRLREGRYGDVTDYGDDPSAIARAFAEAGARRLHVVDLDAARGSGHNGMAIRAIRAATDATLEVGGGIRSMEAAAAAFDAGADRVAIGTLLVRDPDAAGAITTRFPGRIIASIDARDGVVRVAGWRDATGLRATEVAARAETLGFAEIEYTDIARDGMLSGPDLLGTLEIVDAVSIPVVLSGGVSAIEDLIVVARARSPRAGRAIAAAIAGRAILDGTIDVADAVTRLARIEKEHP